MYNPVQDVPATMGVDPSSQWHRAATWPVLGGCVVVESTLLTVVWLVGPPTPAPPVEAGMLRVLDLLVCVLEPPRVELNLLSS